MSTTHQSSGTGFLMVVRHVASIVLLPVTVTLVIPSLILASRLPAPTPLSVILGALLIAPGLTLVVVCVWHFATVGKGTVAPWDPPRRLVVRSVYRYVRNPIITGVILILIGEALALRSVPLLRWAALFFAINAVYIPLFEEPQLIDRFGDDYREYRRHVPRWVPRLTAWAPSDN